MSVPAQQVEVIRDRERAEVLMHPLRRRILEAAREPASAAEMARRLDSTPQKVNYHVRRLVDHGFLRKVAERPAGNVVEKVYASVAESYVLASDVLGGLSPRTSDVDTVTAARWLSLQARAESELGEIFEQAAPTGRPVPTFTMDAEFRFETPEQRALFARAIRDLFLAVVSKYTTPLTNQDGEPGEGRPYRLLLGCYPVPDRLDDDRRPKPSLRAAAAEAGEEG